MHTESPEIDRLIKVREVVALTSMSRAAIYRRVSAGTFPAAVVLGPQCVAWRLSEVIAWRDALPRAVPGAMDYDANARAARIARAEKIAARRAAAASA